MKRNFVVFKSTPEMFEKEKSGRKPNTLRKIDVDPRFDWLKEGVERIRIVNSKTEEFFEREITDVTFWYSWVIISWKHEVSA